MANYYGSICLSEIPKELITTDRNGKKWLNVDVFEMKLPSQWGHTHTIKASVKKEDRKDGVNYYIGKLKPSQYEQQASEPAPAAIQESNDDGLPF